MVPDGTTRNGILLVETGPDRTVEESFLAPLGALPCEMPLRLIGVDRAAAGPALAATGAAAFAAGTRITLAGGRQAPVETLRPGTRVLTRDHGVRPVLWTGRAVRRNAGPFAPITIRAGTLNNDRDLVLSGAHRVFLWRRGDRLGIGRSDVPVRAADLVDRQDVTRAEGGFTEWVQLLFDRHEMIYAEGIAPESCLLDPASRAALPKELRALNREGRAGLDLDGGLGAVPNLAARLRAASRGD